jgi:two-component system sensor histidine kinase BaeS
VEVASLLQSAAEAWRAKASAAGVEVVVEADPGAPSIRTDPRRVRQLVDGLIDNALRVSPERGVIVLAVRPGVEGSIQIEVRDRGPGLTAADAAEAFQRGTLHARYQDTRPVGSGLGLSIAARLVDRLGGSIEAIPGTAGATFRIGLPAAAA